MKILAFVFCYNRPETLKACGESLQSASDDGPQEIVFIDDGSTDPEVGRYLASLNPFIKTWVKGENKGLSDSAVRALAYTRRTNPEYVFFIESDYVFRPHGVDTIMDCFENTEQGHNCLGIVGYDHPNFINHYHTSHGFGTCMRQQVGEDNVNREVLHKPQVQSGRPWPYAISLVSNTCFSCYLNWRKICEVAAEFPELNDLLDQACAPRDNPNYPDSGKYKRERTVDDGMLSHAISLCWNRWAIKHGIDREKNAAWLNITPSVAEHRFQGGTHF